MSTAVAALIVAVIALIVAGAAVALGWHLAAAVAALHRAVSIVTVPDE